MFNINLNKEYNFEINSNDFQFYSNKSIFRGTLEVESKDFNLILYVIDIEPKFLLIESLQESNRIYGYNIKTMGSDGFIQFNIHTFRDVV